MSSAITLGFRLKAPGHSPALGRSLGGHPETMLLPLDHVPGAEGLSIVHPSGLESTFRTCKGLFFPGSDLLRVSCNMDALTLGPTGCFL